MGRENMDPKEVKHFRTFCDFSYFEKKKEEEKKKKKKEMFIIFVSDSDGPPCLNIWGQAGKKVVLAINIFDHFKRKEEEEK